MILVVDTNVIISSLLKRSITQEILFHYASVCYTPEYVKGEIEKHKKEIMKKSEYSEEEFNTVLSIIFSRIMVVPQEDCVSYKDKVLSFTPDDKDWPFLALAMHLDARLWTYDNPLKERQNVVKIVTTKDLVELLRK
ncbi:hypothetical protein HY988_05440 [Candidatus Micrarchaeota archaeon]|nr:hypothetical protein [Candidatus Micrarchaeota archaeon]